MIKTATLAVALGLMAPMALNSCGAKAALSDAAPEGVLDGWTDCPARAEDAKSPRCFIVEGHTVSVCVTMSLFIEPAPWSALCEERN